MSIEAQVKAAVNPQQALIIIAHALDLIEYRLEALADKPPTDAWGDWADTTEMDAKAEEYANSILGPLGKVSAAVSSGATPRIVQKLFDEVPIETDDQVPSSDIILPVPDGERWAKRYQFAKWTLKLDEYYSVEGKPEDDISWSDVYAKGGPYWLYVADRDCVMSYPYQYRQMMVNDIEQDDPAKAQEVAGDILKRDADETGLDKSVPLGEGDIDGKHH